MITASEHRGQLKVTIKASAHDTQQRTISIDASGPRCKLSVLRLQSRICDSLNQDVTTISSSARFFFRAFISSSRVYLRARGRSRAVSRASPSLSLAFALSIPTRDSYSFYHRRPAGFINLGYAPCVWMCKFERALI